jgi:hypothetical protein
MYLAYNACKILVSVGFVKKLSGTFFRKMAAKLTFFCFLGVLTKGNVKKVKIQL